MTEAVKKLFVREYGVYLLCLNPYPPEYEAWKDAVGKIGISNTQFWKKTSSAITSRAVQIGSFYLPTESRLRLPKEFFPFTLETLKEYTAQRGYTLKLREGAAELVRKMEVSQT